ncbi:hypothetical protein [Gordonia sp. ABSL49_1]|uniref:hypothetical protein n=1 Tax=Gordonia sp. ABSL49_1 TaxID=2920941 RepID=UPI001F1031CA|nr:hypothetical protein [Gordonia sp. ABSL49_1]MCH5645161.1 hypothetical protein [Gordonia sp. ABSL49_1]
MIEIVTGVNDDGAVLDTFDGPQVSFMTEPSGALVVFRSPGRVWSAYAPGHWRKVREVSDADRVE